MEEKLSPEETEALLLSMQELQAFQEEEQKLEAEWEKLKRDIFIDFTYFEQLSLEKQTELLLCVIANIEKTVGNVKGEKIEKVYFDGKMYRYPKRYHSRMQEYLHMLHKNQEALGLIEVNESILALVEKAHSFLSFKKRIPVFFERQELFILEEDYREFYELYKKYLALLKGNEEILREESGRSI